MGFFRLGKKTKIKVSHHARNSVKQIDTSLPVWFYLRFWKKQNEKTKRNSKVVKARKKIRPRRGLKIFVKWTVGQGSQNRVKQSEVVKVKRIGSPINQICYWISAKIQISLAQTGYCKMLASANFIHFSTSPSLAAKFDECNKLERVHSCKKGSLCASVLASSPLSLPKCLSYS